jgi:hypothetical protein
MFKTSTLLLGLALCLGTSLSAQELWDNFDSRRQVDYGFIHGVFIEYTQNPVMAGINTSPMAVRYLRNPVETFDVIVTNVGQLADISDYISGAKKLTLDVIAPAPGLTVQITLEDSLSAGPTNYPTGRRAEFTAVSTTSGSWEKLTFNLVNQPDPSVGNTNVNRAVLLVNPGTPATQEWHFDNWFGPDRVSVACEPDTDDPNIFFDGECEQDLDINFYHGQLFRKMNPDISGINTTSHALRYDRSVGEMDDIVIGYFPEALTIPAGSKLVMDVYDVNAPSVYVMALQTAGGADVFVPSDSTSPTEGSKWVRLEYDLNSIAGNTTVERFVMLYKPGQFSVGRTFIDNIQLVPGGIGIGQVTALPSFNLFPNPASVNVTVQLPEVIAGGLLQVFSVEGRQITPARVLTPGASATQTWDTSNWPVGTYLMRWTADGRSANKTFVIQR